MTTPLTPNFNPQSGGRLVTDRYDFEAHVIGTNFRHIADQIDLSPTITIGGSPTTDVQDALNALNNLINAFTPVLATTSVLGIIQLAGDLNGSGTTATTPKVSGLQGFPVLSTPPGASGKVLTWGGSSWSPQFITLGGDIQGAYTSNKVTAISGPSPINVSSNLSMQSGTTISTQSGAGINILSGSNILVESGGLLNMASGSRIRSGLGLIFDYISTPQIKQDAQTFNGSTNGMVIQAQQAYSAATGSAKNGAFLELISGFSSSPGNGTSGNICLITDYTGTFTNALVATPSSVSIFPLNNTPPLAGTFAKTVQTTYNWTAAPSNTINTQSLSYTVYPAYLTTTGVGTVLVLPEFAMPVGTGVQGEVRWVRRNTSTGHTGGGLTQFSCDLAGGISHANVYVSPSASSTDITVGTSGDFFYVECVGPSGTWDWQVIVSINLI